MTRRNPGRGLLSLCALALAACSSAPATTPDGGSPGPDGGTTRSPDGGPTPTPDGSVASCAANTACAEGGNEGICKGGACTICADVSDDAVCVAAYGHGHMCIGGACLVAECRGNGDCGGSKQCVSGTCVGCVSDSDCSAPGTICNTVTGSCVASTQCSGVAQGGACSVNPGDLCCGTGTATCQPVECCSSAQCRAGSTCMAGSCVPTGCSVPTDHTYHIDSAAAGVGQGTGSAACPFKTITHGISLVTAKGENTASDVTLLVTGAINETTQGPGSFPITVPGRITIQGASDTARPVVTVPANKSGFIFNAGKPGGLFSFTIKQATPGTAGAAVWIQNTRNGGNTDNVNVGRVTLTNFNDGILVNNNGYAGLGQDIDAHANTYGLRVLGGFVKSNLAAGAKPSLYDHNKYGIYVGDGSIVQMVGADDTTAPAQTISASHDTYGVRYDSTMAADLLLTPELVHLSVTDNDTVGIYVYTGSKLKLRQNQLLRNGTSGMSGAGVWIEPANGVNSLAGIDLGTQFDGTAGSGKNTFGGNTTGICIATSADGSTLTAEGNAFSGVSCLTRNDSLSWGKDCKSGTNLGFTHYSTSFHDGDPSSIDTKDCFWFDFGN